MKQSEILLSVGENIQVGDHVITIMDIEGDEIIFHIDSPNHPTRKQLERERKDDLPRNPR